MTINITIYLNAVVVRAYHNTGINQFDKLTTIRFWCWKRKKMLDFVQQWKHDNAIELHSKGIQCTVDATYDRLQRSNPSVWP